MIPDEVKEKSDVIVVDKVEAFESANSSSKSHIPISTLSNSFTPLPDDSMIEKLENLSNFSTIESSHKELNESSLIHSKEMSQYQTGNSGIKNYQDPEFLNHDNNEIEGVNYNRSCHDYGESLDCSLNRGFPKNKGISTFHSLFNDDATNFVFDDEIVDGSTLEDFSDSTSSDDDENVLLEESGVDDYIDEFHCLFHPNGSIYFTKKSKIYKITEKLVYDSYSSPDFAISGVDHEFFNLRNMNRDHMGLDYQNRKHGNVQDDFESKIDCSSTINSCESGHMGISQKYNKKCHLSDYIQQNQSLRRDSQWIYENNLLSNNDDDGKKENLRKGSDNFPSYRGDLVFEDSTNNVKFKFKRDSDRCSHDDAEINKNLLVSGQAEGRKFVEKLDTRKPKKRYIIEQVLDIALKVPVFSRTKIVRFMVNPMGFLFAVFWTNYSKSGANDNGIYQLYRLCLDGEVQEMNISINEPGVMKNVVSNDVHGNYMSGSSDLGNNIGNIGLNFAGSSRQIMTIDNDGILYGLCCKYNALLYIDTNNAQSKGIAKVSGIKVKYDSIKDIIPYRNQGVLLVDKCGDHIYYAKRRNLLDPSVLHCFELFGSKALRRIGASGENNLFTVDDEGILYVCIQTVSRVIIKRLGRCQHNLQVKIISELPQNCKSAIRCNNFCLAKTGHLLVDIIHDNLRNLHNSNDLLQLYKIDIAKGNSDLNSTVFSTQMLLQDLPYDFSEIRSTDDIGNFCVKCYYNGGFNSKKKDNKSNLPDNGEVSSLEKLLPSSRYNGSQMNFPMSYFHFYDRNGFFDVQFKSSDNKVINAYRGILASKSDYFFSMFTSHMKEKHSSQCMMINLPDKGSTIMDVFGFIYFGRLNFEKSQTLDEEFFYIWRMADRCCLQKLIESCKNHVHRNINIDNVFEVLEFCIDRGDSYLSEKVRAANYLIDNYKLCIKPNNGKADKILEFLHDNKGCRRLMLRILLDRYGNRNEVNERINYLIIEEVPDIRKELLMYLLNNLP